MSNNIYDILKKMQGLDSPRQTLSEGKTSKPDYIDIDKDGDKKEPMKKAAKDKAKGGMAEAVARVEQQLSEKYTGFKKLEEETEQFRTIKQGAKDLGMGVADLAQGLATMATGGKVRSIDQQRADAQRREQKAIDRAAKEAGYEVGTRYHNQLVNTNPAYRDEYMSLAKDAPMGQLRNIQNQLQLKYDPMGGPMDESTVEESGLQAYLGKKKYGKEGMQALQQAGRDGASKEKMAKIRAQHDKMDENSFAHTPPKHYGGAPTPGSLGFDLYMARQRQELEKQKPKNEEMLSPKEKKFAALAEPKDKITYADKIVGAKKGKKTEGNAFSGALDAARDAGKGEFKVGGKEYKVQEDDGDFTGDMDDRGNLQLSPAGATKVQKHPNYDPNLSANAQYSKHFDDRGYQRMTHDQAVEVGKNPKYNPNLPANAQWDLLNKPGNMQAMKEGRSSMREGWEEMQKYLEKKRGPESKGGSGKKAGTRYGGSAQQDDSEDTDGEGQAVVKKKGRPKGTGGGAKFNFKKPKD